MKSNKKNEYLGSSVGDLFKKESKNPQFLLEYHLERDRLDLARRVKKLREKKHLTQAELADLVGTKQPSIARLESGSSWPRIDLLERIAFALDTHLNIKFVRGGVSN